MVEATNKQGENNADLPDYEEYELFEEPDAAANGTQVAGKAGGAT